MRAAVADRAAGPVRSSAIDLTRPADNKYENTGEDEGEIKVTWVDTDEFLAMAPTAAAAPEGRLWLLTRLGIAALLLINAIYAFLQPAEFAKVLMANVIGEQLPIDLVNRMVTFAGVNDLLLAIAVLQRRWNNLIWFWLASWFAVIAGTKLLNLFF